MIRRSVGIFATAAVTGIFLHGSAGAAAQSSDSLELRVGRMFPTTVFPSLESGQPSSVPAFDLESIDGTRFSSNALEGKVVLVDFWATWCAPCIAEIPQWNELYARYRSKGLVLVGMTIRSGWASDIKPDAAKLKIAYPIVVGNDDVEKGFGGIWGFPTTFLVNRKGQIYKKYTGTYPQKQAQIEAEIQKLLAEKP